MKIGLVDVMRRTRKKKFGATEYPNLALCKIYAYHKDKGDEVEWALPFTHYDRVYMSKIFNFTPDDDSYYIADEIIKGGTGYDIYSQLPPQMEYTQPDFSIYPRVPQDTAFGFLTRGCPNKCPWCVVPKKEGYIHKYMDIEEVLNGRKKAVLMDNNILACGEYAMEQLEKIVLNGYKVDFNQAVDARLVNEDNAKLLAQVKWLENRIRFGCDTKKQIEECDRAMNLIDSFGYKGEYFLYTMLHGSFEECFDRVNHYWLQNQECRKNHSRRVYPYAQPYRDPIKNNTIPQWQKDLASWVNKKQIFESVPFEDFTPRKGFRCKEYVTRLPQHRSPDD